MTYKLKCFRQRKKTALQSFKFSKKSVLNVTFGCTFFIWYFLCLRTRKWHLLCFVQAQEEEVIGSWTAGHLGRCMVSAATYIDFIKSCQVTQKPVFILLPFDFFSWTSAVKAQKCLPLTFKRRRDSSIKVGVVEGEEILQLEEALLYIVESLESS